MRRCAARMHVHLQVKCSYRLNCDSVTPRHRKTAIYLCHELHHALPVVMQKYYELQHNSAPAVLHENLEPVPTVNVPDRQPALTPRSS